MGGDLNLKKSWHPHTMKNQEKVWKAEQAKTQEEKKLHDLRREIEEDKNREELKRMGRESGVLPKATENDKKLDWMYKNSTELINREEYLLGRKIDKSFEILQAQEKEKEDHNLVGVKKPLNHVEHECVPFSIRAYKNLGNSEQVDLQRKVMEDPLMLIKQREIESRKKILENPVKLKELHRILKSDDKLRRMSKKSKKLKNKISKKLKKKRKKRSKSSSSSNSPSEPSEYSDSDLDDKLAKKLKSGLLNTDEAAGLNLSKLLDSKFEKISQELDKATGKRNQSKKKKPKFSNSDSSCSSDQERNDMSKKFSKLSKYEKNINNRKSSPTKKSSASNNYSDIKQDKKYMSTSKSKNQNDSRKSRSVSKNNYRSRSRSRARKSKSRESKSPLNKYPAKVGSREEHRDREKTGPKTSVKSSVKLTEEEKQAKLKQMMSNAAWREEERSEAVRKYRETYAREEERLTTEEFDKNFINKEVKKAMANQNTVGSRLRANLQNIQRSSAAMSSNFVRK